MLRFLLQRTHIMHMADELGMTDTYLKHRPETLYQLIEVQSKKMS